MADGVNGTPASVDERRRIRPYGGVIRPKARLTMMSTPMCTGLMSAAWVSSRISGMKMMIAGIASMKSPTMMNSPTSSSMIMNGSPPATCEIHSETTAGPRR